MNGWSELDCFLRTDPRDDVGCAQATEVMVMSACPGRGAWPCQ
jgi:hypothetical protein